MPPTGAEQRCWNHQIPNVLNDLPKTVQRQTAERLKALPYAQTKAECEGIYAMRLCGPTTGRTRRPWTRCCVTGTAWSRSTRSRKNLDSPQNDEHRGVALLLSSPAHRRLPPVEARGGRHGTHLENAPSRRAVVEKAECTGAVAAGGLRHQVPGRDRPEVRTREECHKPSAGEDRRLKLIYTPLRTS